MKSYKHCIAVICILICSSFLSEAVAQFAKKETYIYAIKGVDTLRFDKYDIPNVTKKKPCIIFAFGGGFIGGVRDNESYQNYFYSLVKNGYSVVSIDYRLGLKNLNPATMTSPMKMMATMKSTVDNAVEDLFDATNVIIQNADAWGIDKNKIIASGSSAGAITVLQGEYKIANKDKLIEKLPEGFRYAGIISFAGAIFSTDGDLKWANSPSPMMLFHGDADGNVPYDKSEISSIGLYGSKYISDQLSESRTPHYFYDVKNANHAIATTPMHDNLTEIKTFINRFAIKEEKNIIKYSTEQLDTKPLNKNFTLEDFIKNNF